MTKRKNIIILGIITCVLISNTVLAVNQKVTANNYFFSIDFIYHQSGILNYEFFNAFVQDLNDIGIDVNLINYPQWVDYVQALLNHNYDLLYIGFTSEQNYNPDYFGLYGETETSFIQYNSSLDWNDTIKDGLNNWFLKEATTIVPPYSTQSINHLKQWQQYLMNDICPILPMFNYYELEASWANLNNYNSTEGILQSWGKMSWEGFHPNQNNQSEIRISDNLHDDFNPLFNNGDNVFWQLDDPCLEKILWIDPNNDVKFHLADQINFINESTFTITLREGIKWANDIDNTFENEYLDSEDLYFTFFCWKYLSDSAVLFNFLKEFKILDKYTLEVTIDSDEEQLSNQFSSSDFYLLNQYILPEHYLNQSQLGDGITPNISHTSWNIFSDHYFGTGLFRLENYSDNSSLEFILRDDSWWLNSSITQDPNLNWANRFGTFTSDLEILKIETDLNPAECDFELKNGTLDIIDIDFFVDDLDDYSSDSRFDVHYKLGNMMQFLFFNMNEQRKLGNREICPNDNNISIGLALRKAISYAIDRQYIRDTFRDSTYTISDWPICSSAGIWLNPKIIKYNYDLCRAKEHLYKAGYISEDYHPCDYTGYTHRFNTEGLIVSICIVITIQLIIKKWKKQVFRRH